MIVKASPTGIGAPLGRLVTVDFGTGAFDAKTVVSDTTITANSSVVAQLVTSDETAMLDRITAYIVAVTPGVGYTVLCSSVYGSVGQFTVNCIVTGI
jgi:hypothetical protein